MLKQRYGREASLNVSNIYMQFEEKNGTKVTFSVPSVEDYSHLDATIVKNEYISPLYQ